MNTASALRILAAGAALALAGCLNGADEPLATDASKMAFSREVGLSAAKAAKISTAPGFDAEIAAEQMRKIGCPRLANLFSDFNAPTNDGSLPSSFASMAACFDIGNVTSDAEARDAIQKKFENFRGLLDCVCGGTGLSDLLDANGFDWNVFQGGVSTAAGAAFSGSASTTGNSFSGGQSSASGSGFSGAQSSATGD